MFLLYTTGKHLQTPESSVEYAKSHQL